MSILYTGTAINKTTDLWLKTDSTLGASYSEIMTPVVTQAFVNGNTSTIGSVSFPANLTKQASLLGWIRMDTAAGNTIAGTFYLSTTVTPSSGGEGITVSGTGPKIFNLTGLQCPCTSTNVIYLLFVPTASNGSVVTYSITPGSFVYSTMPSNNNVGYTNSRSLVVIGT